ncbi:hypothetical protein Cob_v013181 [Colletotrichum orbiculare MAFF 240422]|uniref:C2H2-type domain-containing protein n=1 Tax=Colletotrichum orbiculare (strain 104-T / ATCC 96160 / CBS 514.97 / LARS 414 / MAFF 240422) TaxID=1213857 RepID=A0A484F8H4_COLOR|nr:hypothetical protein Cob_v013181 [Colletotrichum orbiculare MAFF 240422]
MSPSFWGDSAVSDDRVREIHPSVSQEKLPSVAQALTDHDTEGSASTNPVVALTQDYSYPRDSLPEYQTLSFQASMNAEPLAVSEAPENIKYEAPYRGEQCPERSSSLIYTEEDGYVCIAMNGESHKIPHSTKPAAKTAGVQPRARPVSKRKRKQQQDDNDHSDDHTMKDGGAYDNDSGADSDKKFACPFFKYDRVKHFNCLHFRLLRVKDVKQHILRKHHFFCGNCKEVFPDSKKCEEHIAMGPVCQTKRRPRREATAARDALSERQRRSLSEKPKPSLTETERWFALWDVLFPRRSFPGLRQPPSPFLESEVHEAITMVQQLVSLHGLGGRPQPSWISDIDAGDEDVPMMDADDASHCSASPSRQLSESERSAVSSLIQQVSTMAPPRSSSPECPSRAVTSGSPVRQDMVYPSFWRETDAPSSVYGAHELDTSFGQFNEFLLTDPTMPWTQDLKIDVDEQPRIFEDRVENCSDSVISNYPTELITDDDLSFGTLSRREGDQ